MRRWGHGLLAFVCGAIGMVVPAAATQPLAPIASLEPGESLPVQALGGTWPNLTPMAPYDIRIDHADAPHSAMPPAQGATGKSRVLRFTTTTFNRGRYSLELIAAPAPGATQRQPTVIDVRQCLRFQDPAILGAARSCLGHASVGSATYDPTHQHLHMPGFVRFALRQEGRATPGRPGTGGVIAQAERAVWCVSDMYNWRTDPIVETDPPFAESLAHSLISPWDRAWYRECSTPALVPTGGWRQGLSPGWADSAPATAPGQQLPLGRAQDGVYWLTVTVNPRRLIRETNYSDNTAAARIQIYAGGTKARLLSPLPGPPYTDWWDNPPNQPGH